MTIEEHLTAYLTADDALLDALARGEVGDEYHPAAVERVRALAALQDAARRETTIHDALRAQLAQVTAERDALRELLADVESGEAPTCEEHGDGTTLATQLDDAGNLVCDEHSDGIVCRRDLPHADVIRTLPRGR